MRLHRVFAGIALTLSVACSGGSAPQKPVEAPEAAKPPAPPPADAHAPKVLGELDGITIASYAPVGFDALTPSQRALAYHLTQAALQGDIIYTMQRSHFGLPALKTVRTLLANSEKLNPQMREKLAQYRRMLLIQAGPYDRWTMRKFEPPLTRDEFEKAAHDAGVLVPTALVTAMFDPNVAPALLDTTPGPGKDPLVLSGVNHYEGLSSKELKGFKEKYELNGHVSKENGRIVEQVFRAGDATTPPGLAAPELRHVIEHLQAAIELAPPAEAEALGHLVRYFTTGDATEFRKHDIAWLAQPFPVDYILGFIETHLDVRGRKGNFEGYVGIADPGRNAPLQVLAQNAAYFEQQMPWPKEFKRDVFRPPAATAIRVLGATGDAGFYTFGGVNLPNAAELREKYGSKNFLSISVSETREALIVRKLADEFVAPESRAEAQRCLSALRFAAVAFHEVTGHGSGKVKPGVGEPDKVFGSYGSVLEEGRANLVADYMMGDAKTLEIGLLPDAGCVRVWPAVFEAAHLQNLLLVPTGDRIEEGHLQGDWVFFGVLQEKGIVSLEDRDGKTYIVVKDLDAWRRAAGELLAEHQRIKATGDRAALVALVEKYGTHLNTALRDQVVARVKALHLPRAVATVPPMLTPIRDATGKVIDAKAEQVTSLDAYLDALEHANDGA